MAKLLEINIIYSIFSIEVIKYITILFSIVIFINIYF